VGYQGPCDPARPIKVAGRCERPFASGPNHRVTPVWTALA
jgi:hypothetical protein